ncbi:MAG: GNAT family protein [Myxococcota bacterium]
MSTALQVSWKEGGLRLLAQEPTDDEIRRHAAVLAAWVNDPHNTSMLANTQALTPDEVVAQYAEMRAEGARVFFLYVDGELVGDADLRNVTPPVAEFAIMVGPRGTQARGLGTRFTTMVHALAFGELALTTVYLSIVPRNEAARRCYLKVGYVEDGSPEARRYTDEETDVAMSLSREAFLRKHGESVKGMRVGRR